MIVCLCKGVSCSAVRRAVDQGASDLASVGRACGAGTDCGSCHAQIEDIVYEELSSRSGARHLPIVQAGPSIEHERDDNRAA
jgi:bacterioferritin-associated ferredoxin